MRSFVNEEIQVATVITAAETVIGLAIDVANYDYMIIWWDYSKGDETSYKIIPKFLKVKGGDEYPLMSWSPANDMVRLARTFLLTATGKAYALLDVRGIRMVKIYGDATGGTPTGTVQIGYTLQRKI
jgi:hypothetical protein